MSGDRRDTWNDLSFFCYCELAVSPDKSASYHMPRTEVEVAHLPLTNCSYRWLKHLIGILASCPGHDQTAGT